MNYRIENNYRDKMKIIDIYLFYLTPNVRDQSEFFIISKFKIFFKYNFY